MLIRHKSKSFFTSMVQSYASNRDKVAIVFSNSDSLWTHQTLYANSRALANGFSDLNFIRGDTVLVKLKRENFKQKILLKVAAANLRVKLIESKGQNQEEIEAELKAHKARCFMFNPHESIGQSSLLDSVYRILPEISNVQSESEIMPYKFKFLRSLVQVDSYQYAGTYSLSKLLRYESVEHYNYGFECDEKPADIRQKRMIGRPIVMTDPLHQLSFRAGLLNSMTKGNVIFCCFPEGVRQISQKFEHQIDVICTEPLSDLHSENRVFVEAGSVLYKKHPRRKQISL